MMKWNFKKGLITCGLAVSIAILANYSPAFSVDNVTLSAIRVEGTNDAFTITLKTSRDTEILSKVQSANRLVLELSNTRAAELIKTSFKNAGQIEDVIVQPLKNDRTRILLSGNNVSKSKIIIDSTQTPVIADKFAEDNPLNTNNNVNNTSMVTVPNDSTSNTQNAIENAASHNQVVNSKDFIDQNLNNQPNNTNIATNSDQTNNTENIQPTIEKQTTETTGIVASPQNNEKTSLEDNNINTEASDNQSQDSSLFKPAADLDSPASEDKTNNNNQVSAAAATARSLSNPQENSLLSNTWLLRFGILFVFITLLVAYLRKEKIVSFNLKPKKQQLNTEHIDIYRSLHNSTKASPPYNRALTNSKAATLTGNATKQQYKKTSDLTKQLSTKNLAQHTALNNYKTQKPSPKNSALKAMKLSPNYNTSENTQRNKVAATKSKLTKMPADNISFLKSMADIYEKSGRHDLAMTIQKKIRQSTAKA